MQKVQIQFKDLENRSFNRKTGPLLLKTRNRLLLTSVPDP